MTRYRNVLLFAVLAALWGSAFMAIKAGLLAGIPPVLFAAVRYDIAGVIMLAYALVVLDDPLPRGRGQWALVTVGSVLLIAAYHALLFIGETDPNVNSAAAAVIVSLSPVLTTGFARGLLPKERLNAAGVVGLLLGLVGVAVLADLDPGNLLAGGVVAKLLVLGATASFALGSVLTRRIDAEMPIESMEAWSMLGGALLMHLLSLGLGESPAAVAWFSFDVLWSLTYLSVGASAVGFLIYFDLLDRLGPIQINLVSYVAPVFAALSGWVVLNEEPTVATFGGFVLIFLGFLLLKRDAIRDALVRRGTVSS
ncbi:Permease of the drug/metabolite transporter (DMT) superfamily [Halogranum gelatinilyticum]|uniref:Permease of the drug/metabolite transporter (DMT) superfamily n=1 Tax=Halogranum gelatinilyticum TaxID=660521 RepID=A0A1G9TKQ3_9EURY|nr:DMT family transporter [Halogranum gelatinilyticum]SDM48321.1 Permease of the drug/metabolite transporter (DMT) superfamily [Halogranum gelatinilyticum]